MADQYMRNSHWLDTLKVGDTDYGVWKSAEGGAVTSEATVIKPGGMRPGVAVPGGAPTVEAVTLTKHFSQADAASVYASIVAQVGKGAQATHGKQPLDYSGMAFGTPIMTTGVVSSVTPPQSDSESDDVSALVVVITPNGI